MRIHLTIPNDSTNAHFYQVTNYFISTTPSSQLILPIFFIFFEKVIILLFFIKNRTLKGLLSVF
ncbi:hypothetical protein FM106_06585 [Brachybacterium faecium]|nr:hypothetical protein FM106_06585 [Brachybacterium faecium]